MTERSEMCWVRFGNFYHQDSREKTPAKEFSISLGDLTFGTGPRKHISKYREIQTGNYWLRSGTDGWNVASHSDQMIELSPGMMYTFLVLGDGNNSIYPFPTIDSISWPFPNPEEGKTTVRAIFPDGREFQLLEDVQFKVSYEKDTFTEYVLVNADSELHSPTQVPTEIAGALECNTTKYGTSYRQNGFQFSGASSEYTLVLLAPQEPTGEFDCVPHIFQSFPPLDFAEDTIDEYQLPRYVISENSDSQSQQIPVPSENPVPEMAHKALNSEDVRQSSYPMLPEGKPAPKPWAPNNPPARPIQEPAQIPAQIPADVWNQEIVAMGESHQPSSHQMSENPGEHSAEWIEPVVKVRKLRRITTLVQKEDEEPEEPVQKVPHHEPNKNQWDFKKFNSADLGKLSSLASSDKLKSRNDLGYDDLPRVKPTQSSGPNFRLPAFPLDKLSSLDVPGFQMPTNREESAKKMGSDYGANANHWPGFNIRSYPSTPLTMEAHSADSENLRGDAKNNGSSDGSNDDGNSNDNGVVDKLPLDPESQWPSPGVVNLKNSCGLLKHLHVSFVNQESRSDMSVATVGPEDKQVYLAPGNYLVSISGKLSDGGPTIKPEQLGRFSLPVESDRAYNLQIVCDPKENRFLVRGDVTKQR